MSNNFIENYKSKDKFKSNEIEELTAEEFFKETGHEKSRIEELTDFDGQLDLFDTFEPEEMGSEGFFKDSEESFTFLEEIPEKEDQEELLTRDGRTERRVIVLRI